MRSIIETLDNIDLKKGTSKDFNNIIKDLNTYVINLTNKANYLSKTLQENQDVLLYENMLLNNNMNDLLTKVKNLELQLNNQSTNGSKSEIYKSLYNPEFIDNGENYLLDSGYGLLTLDYNDSLFSSLSKFPIEYLQEQIDINVEYQLLGFDNQIVSPVYDINISEDKDLMNIILHDATKIWSKKITTSTSVNGVVFRAIINIPLKLVSNLNINSIGIKPLINGIYDLNYIKCIGLDNIKENYILSNKIEGIDNIKFTFDNTKTVKIVLELEQHNYITVSNDERKFIIGFKAIDLESINPIAEKGYFISKLDITNLGKHFARVYEPQLETLGNINYNSLIKHELLYESNPLSPTFTFGANISAPIQTVYIKTTIVNSNNVIPFIRGIKFSYLPK